jgi:hypothetical protein
MQIIYKNPVHTSQEIHYTHNKDQPVDAVQEDNCRLFWESHEIQTEPEQNAVSEWSSSWYV